MKNLTLILLSLSFFDILSQKAYQKNLAVAEAYFKVEEFSNALNYYIRSYNLKKTTEAALKIGDCHLKLYEYKQAVNWYHEVYLDGYNKPSFYKSYAIALKSNGDFNRAKSVYIQYANFFEKEKADNFIMSIDSCEKWTQSIDTSVYLKNFKALNTEYSEINPTIYKSGVVFSSSKESIIIKTRDGQNDQPYYNLYYSDTTSTGKWKKPSPFSANLNTFDHEGAVAFSKDQKTLFLTRGIHQEYTKDSIENKINYLKLYKSEKHGKNWSKPLHFTLNDSLASFGHPSIGYNDKVFIFASDIPGGYGGTDLYVTFKLDSGWKKPINMGNKINTPENELYPHILNDGTLYFSSNGHLGLGGFDNFVAKLENGEWQSPKNLKTPLNTSYDDFSIFIDEQEKSGYFSSNRPKGLGKEDIYIFKK